MEHPVNFARQFAQLVWLLIREPANVAEQKLALRAVAERAKSGVAHLALHPGGLRANDQPVPAALTGMSEVATQMRLHGLALIIVDENALPADLLNVARILAAMPVTDDGGAAAEAQRRTANVTTIRFAARPALANDPPPAPLSLSRETPSGPIPEMDFGDIFDDPLAEAAARATPRSTQAVTGPIAKSRSDGAGSLFSQFASRVPTQSAAELLAGFETTRDSNESAQLLEDLCIVAEKAAKDGKPAIVTEILFRLGRREQEMPASDAKRALGMSLRRLAKPPLLKAVAMQLPVEHEQRGQLMAVLMRTGEDGADALIELLSDQAHQRDRRAYFDALVQLKAGSSALLHMLQDSRWFAVRNAAELLGELQVREAEGPLSDLARHEDERVRKSATAALMRLGTPRAMESITKALADTDAQMRSEAAVALATRREPAATQVLLKALDAEKDPEVQATMMLALGRMATRESVERLVQAANGERGLFKKRPTPYRVAAVHGLSEAKTPESLDALRALQQDKDDSIRGAATFGLRRASRGTVIARAMTTGESPTIPRVNEP